MESILLFLQEHIAVAPLMIFLLLTAAGGNIPVSEDVITITAALMAARNRSYVPLLLIALVAGALSGDTVAYWIGRGAGRLLLQRGPEKRRIAWRLKIETMRRYLNRYAVPFLIFGRYIPFGFRNVLHITAGVNRMPYWKYLLIDAVAVLLTTNLLFWLVLWFGTRAADIIKTAQIIFLVFITLALAALLIWRRVWRRSGQRL